MLKLIQSEINSLQELARDKTIESCAFGLVFPLSKNSNKYVVRHLQEVPENAYIMRTATEAILKPEYCVEIVNKARAAEAGVMLAHTHPGSFSLEGFSSIDDRGEQALVKYFDSRLPNKNNFSAVFTTKGIYARKLGHGDLVSTMGLGSILTTHDSLSFKITELYNRQVLAFGCDGQQKISRIKVAIIGLGGTGSVIAQQLAYLGVNDYVLIDPDVVEVTNINRLVGATLSDIGQSKVSVASRQISNANPRAKCDEIMGDITDQGLLEKYIDVDFIFACTDSMSSRAVLNQLAYQYLIPCIDMGVGIYTNNGEIQYITGRTQMLSPSLPCLVCMDRLDAEQIRQEFMTVEQRERDQYIIGAKIPQPAVISINSLVSSSAITMFLAAVAGLPSEPRMLIYDGMRGTIRPSIAKPKHHCIVCSYEGALARGNSWTLPFRRSK